jgi:KaiC/GvpD/RAD55 family RecA-like ATPase
MSTLTEYNEEIQELFVRFLISDADLYIRCQAIIDPSYFSFGLKRPVEFILEHSAKYGTLPTLDQISAVSGVELEKIADVNEDHQDWFLAEFETFCRRMALKAAIIESSELLKTDRFGEAEELVKAANQIALVKDLGLDYFENPRERLEWIKNRSGATSTGWLSIDHKLYGGVNRGEITIMAGASGSGKSLFLQNFGVNWALAGLNVVYVSLELSEQLISLRLDSMVSGIAAKDIMRNIDNVELTVATKGKTSGKFRVKYMPSGTTVNQLRAFIKEYQIQTGIKIDAVLVDYLDLLMPNNVKVSPSDLFIKDKYVSEELRNLAMELQVLMVSASQINRSGTNELELDHSHIAGGISKIHTADNVIGIFTSNAMRERGRYQIQFLKTRSSAGVGSKVDLSFNVDTLRIVDLDPDEESSDIAAAGSILDRLKRSGSTIIRQEPEPADTVTASLDLLNYIKKR